MNSDKKQVTAIHLRNRDTKTSLNVPWKGVDLENTAQPKYLGVTFDRTLSYKQHIYNKKMKVGKRNNILKKLTSTQWVQIQALQKQWHWPYATQSQNSLLQYGRDLICRHPVPRTK